MLAGAGVALAVGTTSLITYFGVVNSLGQLYTNELDAKAMNLASAVATVDDERLRDELLFFRRTNPGYRVAVSPEPHTAFIGDPIHVDRMARAGQGETTQSTTTVGGEWITVIRQDSGQTVALARSTGTYEVFRGALMGLLMGIVGLGILLAAVAAAVIAPATVRPVEKLRRSVEGVTSTDELKPIDVEGEDELARLTLSLNDMMASLKESRVRQTQLVADAGHELRTPLTSMRTNIELLMLLYRTGQEAGISEEDRKDLESDVLAQMDEMATLVGDLVDLAREDLAEAPFEDVRFDGLLHDALERVQRRRPDVRFQFHADPWVLEADRYSLSRAPVNLLDNAAKWSPEGGTVRVSLRAAKRRAVLIIDDSGPGIAPEEREKVFERFYRAPESRSMPGSGLGLAITKQVLDRHGAKIFVEESDDGGTRMRVVLPGHPPVDEDQASQ
ncbi:Signal transduction histidine-protein kinase/phosphatase MprB [Corynebacterium aquatimens]|nr:Signal transduction histidine-protein kinase/phosphatase MprB [Corynebacterium aquatimens]